MSTISNERVEFYATTKPPFGYTGSDINTMARELLALRKERKRAEPVAYIIQDADARDRGLPGFLSYDGSISDEDINEYEISLTPLYTAPHAPVVSGGTLQGKLLTAEQLQSIIDDDWLLMDDCEGMENCAEIKALARMAMASLIASVKHDYLCDSAYVSGMQAGWNFGVVEDSAGFQSSLEHYRKGMREYRAGLRTKPQSVAKTDTTSQQFESLAGKAVVPGCECNHVWSALNRADTLECIYCGILKRDWIPVKTPPTPVVPDELTWEEAPCESIEYVYGWNACRAAMLKGSDDAAS